MLTMALPGNGVNYNVQSDCVHRTQYFKFCTHTAVNTIDRNKIPLTVWRRVAVGKARDSRKFAASPCIGTSHSHLCDSMAFLLLSHLHMDWCYMYRVRQKNCPTLKYYNFLIFSIKKEIKIPQESELSQKSMLVNFFHRC